MPVVRAMGMDPSMNNWGLVAGLLDTSTSLFTPKSLQVIQAEKLTGKQYRPNQIDVDIGRQIANGLRPYLEQRPEVIFAEFPIGSQSASAMKGYGMCMMGLGSMSAYGFHLIRVTPRQVKLAMTGNPEASKKEMIEAAVAMFPNAPWPRQRGRVIESKSEHMADAIGAVVAGLASDEYQHYLQELQCKSK